MRYLKNLLSRLKKALLSDPVFLVSWILAIVSAFFVPPDREYLSYIDWRSLGILWALMVIIRGFHQNSLFEKIGDVLLRRVGNAGQLSLILVLLCFFSGMLITNDVALITFVPFAIMVLRSCGRTELLIPVIVLQTVAANTGSMLTPIGNPQNLYLYGSTGMTLGDFVLTMLPYALLSCVLLILFSWLMPGRKEAISLHEKYPVFKSFGSKKQILIYSLLFLAALLSVLRILPWYAAVILVLVVVLFVDFSVLLQADYILLLTFCGFFIFTGNISRIPEIHEFLSQLVSGREFSVSLVISQVISNVPATLLLTDFSEDLKSLLLGVNVGGLGTLIASMASLISWKAYVNICPEKKGRYFLVFTLFNLIFLFALCVLRAVLSRLPL